MLSNRFGKLLSQILAPLWKDNKALFLFLVLMAVFRSSVADWNYIPSGSMRPTLIEGDRVVINKLAYDVQVPFTHHSLMQLADPERGDIVVFESMAAGKRLIKRVVGVPGDTVSVVGNRLFVNEQALSYKLFGEDESEYVLLESDGVRTNRIRLGIKTRAGLAGLQRLNGVSTTVVVPDNNYFVLGDNRGNSADSRYIGFVPREEMIGRSNHVAFSHDPDRYYIPRTKRWFEQLDPR